MTARLPSPRQPSGIPARYESPGQCRLNTMGKTNAKHGLGIAAGLVVSAGAMIWFVKGVDDWGAVWQTIKSLRFDYFLFALLATLITYMIRAYRWRVFLEPVKRCGIMNLLSATCIGYMANCVLPARLGEFIRPGVISRREKISYVTAFATAVIERIFDLVGLFIMLAVTWIALHPDQAADPAVAENIEKIKRYGVIIVPCALAALAGVAVMAIWPGPFLKLAEFFASFLPDFIRFRLMGFVRSVVDAFKVMTGLREVALVVALSSLWWFVIGASMWFLALGLDLHIGFFGGCFVSILVGLAVALPQAPGYLGVFPKAASIAMVVVGCPTDKANAYALVLWTLSVAPITVIGMAFAWREGLSLGQLAHQDEKLAEKSVEPEGIDGNKGRTECLSEPSK